LLSTSIDLTLSIFNGCINNCGETHVSVIKLLVKNGLKIKTNALLKSACEHNNLNLVEYLLGYGLGVDSEILEIVFTKKYINIIKILYKITFLFHQLNKILVFLLKFDCFQVQEF